MIRRDPTFLGDEFVTNHVDLRDGSAPGHQPKPEETPKHTAVRLAQRAAGIFR
jgi:hypothetical protein